MTRRIGPSYQLVADDIRARIRSGEYQVGQAIPSTTKLMEQHGVSSTVVRHAVEQLRDDGVLIGHGGKAVFVQATPDDAAEERGDTRALAAQVSALRDEVHALTQRVGSLDSAGLHEALGRIEGNLIELYGKTANEYPWEEAPGGARRSRAAGERGGRRERRT